MENNNTANENNAPRQREHGNFRGQRVMRDLSELDPKQFTVQKPREERIPVWAQQLQTSIDLLSQEQQKMVNQLDALIMLQADSSSEEDLKSSIEAGFSKVRENQNNAYEELLKKIESCTLEKGSLMAIMGMLQNIKSELQPRAKRTLDWKICHPITAIKEWLEKTAEERRKNKAAKLEEQLRKLRAEQ